MKLRDLLGLKSQRSSIQLSRRSRRQKFAFEMLEERRVLAGWTLGLESTGSSYNDAYSVLETPLGDVYVTGNFFGAVNFNPKGSPTVAVTLTNNSSASDAFLAKYSSAGDLVWARTLSGNSSSVESGRAIALDGSGNVYISGHFGGSAQFHKENGTTTGAPLSATGTTNATNVFVAKLTASGDVTSAWTLGNAYLGVSTRGLPAETLAVDSTGNVWLAGTFTGTANFGSVSLTAAGTSKNSSPTDIFVTKLDPGLNGAQWVGQMGGSSNETGAGLALDSSNNVYITGSFSGTSDFNPGPSVTNVTSSGSSSSNIFLTKLDSLGGFVWAKDLGPGGANQVAIGKTPVGNNVYVDNVVLTAQRTGVGVFDLDPGPGSTNLNTFFAIAQYTINGELNWAIGLTERVRGIDTDSIGNVYASGRFSGTVDFDPGTRQVILTSVGIGDSNTTLGEGYVSKYDSSGNLSWVRRMGSADSDQANAVMVGATGNVFVAGSHNRTQVLPSSTADFPTGDILTGKGGFAMKLEQLPNGKPSVATITGSVFQDANSDGINNDGSVAPTPLPKVYIDLNNNGLLDPSEPNTTPYASGVYSININALAIGTYHVRQDLLLGWTFTTPSEYVITVDAISDQLFVQKDFGSINLNPSTKFYVVNDSTTTSDQTYKYGDVGASIGNYSLNSGNTAPRGAASTITGDKVWVVDANKKVYVYNTSGGLIGSWTAGSLPSNATPEGITTNGTDIWIVDGNSHKVYKYAGAAISNPTGTVIATSSFSLSTSNSNPKDLVTDGISIWVVNDSTTDTVFVYSLTGTYQFRWTIETPGTGNPTGITLDPSNVNRIWIVDNATDRVYQYDGAALGGFPGKLAASASFALAPGNTNPQGIADPPVGDRVQLVSTAMAPLTSSKAIDFALVQLSDDYVRRQPVRTLEIDHSDREQSLATPLSTNSVVQFPTQQSMQPSMSENRASSQSKRLGGTTDDIFSNWNADELKEVDL